MAQAQHIQDGGRNFSEALWVGLRLAERHHVPRGRYSFLCLLSVETESSFTVVPRTRRKVQLLDMVMYVLLKSYLARLKDKYFYTYMPIFRTLCTCIVFL